MSDRIPLDPMSLTIRDLKRAKAGPLEGRNPLELVDDPLESATLVVWCVRSRDDAEFTWADAEQTPLGDFDLGDDGSEAGPPPGASPGEPSARRDTGGTPPTRRPKPTGSASRSGSGSSSGSTTTATTP